MDDKVTIAISTLGGRINSISLPAFLAGVRYMILHQAHDDCIFLDHIRECLGRKDVEYVTVPQMGLSISRNYAIEHAKTPYIHLMDDDVEIDAGSILKLANLAERAGYDVAIGCFAYEDGRLSKSKISATHTIFTSFSVCSIELCVHKRVGLAGVWFDIDLGLGTEHPSGEEFVFLSDCRKAGLRVGHFDVCIGIHPNLTSGDDFYSTDEKILAKRIMLERGIEHGAWFFKLLFILRKFPVLYSKRRLIRTVELLLLRRNR